MMITKELINIATFDLIPTEKLDDLLWYFPEAEAFTPSFETAGIEARIILQNGGLIFYLILLNLFLSILHLLLIPTISLGICF